MERSYFSPPPQRVGLLGALAWPRGVRGAGVTGSQLHGPILTYNVAFLAGYALLGFATLYW